MAANATLTAYAQSVRLVVKGKYYDDIAGEDGQAFIDQIIDWTNQFIDELELETDAEGKPIDWAWVRELGATLGRARLGRNSVDLDDDVNNVIAGEERYVLITNANGEVVSRWAVIEPGQMKNSTSSSTKEMVTMVSQQLVFSRKFNEAENGGTITGDITLPIPRLSLTNQDALTTVRPKQLLILGTAKNVTLPDIVQGGLSPSYSQKYKSLLDGAIARNSTSSMGDIAQTDDLSGIRGVGT